MFGRFYANDRRHMEAATMTGPLISHETVERALTTEPNRILNSLPQSPDIQHAKELVKLAADLAHRAVESVEMAEKGATA